MAPRTGAWASATALRRVAACALVAALLTGCAQSVDPIARMGRKAAQKVRHDRPGHGASGGARGDRPGHGASGGARGDRLGAGATDGARGVRPGAGAAGRARGDRPGEARAGEAREDRPRGGGEADRAGAADTVDTIGAAGAAGARGAVAAPGALGTGPRSNTDAAPGAPVISTAPAHRVFPPRARGAIPPVVGRVPTRDRVVFLAFDDGAGADPRFAALVRRLRLPVSVFLTGAVAGPGRDHFGELRALGAGIQNRTLTRPFLPGLGHVAQHAEICGQQDRLKGRFGTAPRLLSPPYGAYDADTLWAAGACGIDAIVLGRTHGDGDPLRPGDIIHTHAAPSLTRTTTRLLERIRAQHLKVARLESYL